MADVQATEMPQAAGFHGGNLDWAERRFGRPGAGWIDLSTGINPWAYPFDLPSQEQWSRLPTEAENRALKTAAAVRYGVDDLECVVPAPGSQSLIQLLPRLRAAGEVAIFSPTYGEHAAAWTAAGHSVREVGSEAEVKDTTSVVVATNPNNPDGRIITPDRLQAVRETLSRRNGWLVVDEAFADVVPEASVAGDCGKEGVIVLRSFGKFYGLAGLRLGFALAAPELSRRLATALGPWAVGGPAIGIGIQALSDDAWQRKTLMRLSETSKRIDALLERAGLTITGGTPLFRYATGAEAAGVFERLGHAGILVRHFPERPNWLRFGLPADDAAFERLAVALLD